MTTSGITVTQYHISTRQLIILLKGLSWIGEPPPCISLLGPDLGHGVVGGKLGDVRKELQQYTGSTCIGEEAIMGIMMALRSMHTCTCCCVVTRHCDLPAMTVGGSPFRSSQSPRVARLQFISGASLSIQYLFHGFAGTGASCMHPSASCCHSPSEPISLSTVM